MKTIAFLTNLNAAGMDQTGKFNPLYVLKTFPCFSQSRHLKHGLKYIFIHELAWIVFLYFHRC